MVLLLKLFISLLHDYMTCDLCICLNVMSQLARRLREKAKDGPLVPVANGESAKPAVTKKRGRWDQTAPDENIVPAKKKPSWDTAEVSTITP